MNTQGPVNDRHARRPAAGFNGEVDVPLNYADYYFLEALLRYQALPGR